jgi:hypothetical protein
MHATTTELTEPEARQPAERPSWLRRLGQAGFLIFLDMGLLWLTVPVASAGGRAMTG